MMEFTQFSTLNLRAGPGREAENGAPENRMERSDFGNEDFQFKLLVGISRPAIKRAGRKEFEADESGQQRTL